jgi:hypothetical protein
MASAAKNRTTAAVRKQMIANSRRGVRDGILDREADQLDAQAAELLNAELPAVVSAGEVVPQVRDVRVDADIVQSVDNRQWLVDTLEHPDQIARDASTERTGLLCRESVDITASALDMAVTIGAKNSAEKSLAHQMALAHDCAFEMADIGLQLAQQVDVLRPLGKAMQIYTVESARMMNASANMMKAFQSGMVVMQKIRHGHTQTMIVQHQNVTVSDGGQAVIGNVASRGLMEGDNSNDK